MKTILKTRVSLVQKLRLLPMLAAVSLGVIVALVIFYFSAPKTSIAGNAYKYPSMIFKNPVLISGTAGQVNAVYRFSNVATGIDAHIRIISLYNGTTLNDMDYFTAGYYDAWQPFINSPANSTSWINWQIKFKMAGTNTDTVLTRLAATAVDVDGDGSALKEIVGAYPVSTYSALAGAQVVVTYRNDSCIATSSTNNVANIDTNRTQAMFMKIFNNVSTINYRTGAVNGGSGSQVRQNSIYFKYFDMMPSPLPVELISFKAAKMNNERVEVKWSTASEKNNDFFTLERSQDGINFTEIKKIGGGGNSSGLRNYTIIDMNPKSGLNYYRLSQTDFDGTSEVFKPVVVDMGTAITTTIKAKVVPNPFMNSFQVLFNTEEENAAQVLLLSLNGHVIFKDNIEVAIGKNEYEFSNGDELKPGAYILKIQTDTKVLVSEKVVKN
jgi:hypothetical protein